MTAAPVEDPIPSLAEGEVHLWTAGLDAVPEDLDPVMRRLPLDEIAAAAGMRAPQRRRQFVAGRLMLRSLLSRYLHPAAASRPFRYLPDGKPELPPPHDGALQFNLAHSGDVVAVALTARGAVGLDIERIRPVSHLDAVARTYFTERERAWLNSRDANAKQEGFLFLWTCKEAVAKATGKGISGGWTDFEVLAGPAGAAGVRPAGPAAGIWHLIRPAAVPGYTAALAVPRAGIRARTFEWTPEVTNQ